MVWRERGIRLILNASDELELGWGEGGGEDDDEEIIVGC